MQKVVGGRGGLLQMVFGAKPVGARARCLLKSGRFGNVDGLGPRNLASLKICEGLQNIGVRLLGSASVRLPALKACLCWCVDQRLMLIGSSWLSTMAPLR